MLPWLEARNPVLYASSQPPTSRFTPIRLYCDVPPVRRTVERADEGYSPAGMGISDEYVRQSRSAPAEAMRRGVGSRYFNVYGPRQSKMSSVIKNAADGPGVSCFPSDYARLPKGENYRPMKLFA